MFKIFNVNVDSNIVTRLSEEFPTTTKISKIDRYNNYYIVRTSSNSTTPVRRMSDDVMKCMSLLKPNKLHRVYNTAIYDVKSQDTKITFASDPAIDLKAESDISVIVLSDNVVFETKDKTNGNVMRHEVSTGSVIQFYLETNSRFTHRLISNNEEIRCLRFYNSKLINTRVKLLPSIDTKEKNKLKQKFYDLRTLENKVTYPFSNSNNKVVSNLLIDVDFTITPGDISII